MAMFVAHIPHEPPPTVFASYMFSNMTSLGWLEGLKRCRNPECQQFFIGRPNVKWCSKSCGSLYRVRQKRKRDKS
ncbi:MAG: CGNR zinc finger domain-containing protein [Bdellovibrionaceae bacterium]|nr:CGNR zinc finger domain-containing protein [Pseudobdellovibrionaceae bacterium]